MPDTGLSCVKGLTGSLTKAIPIQLFVCILQGEQTRMNVRYWSERSRGARDGLKAPLGGGMHPVRKLKRAQIFLAPTLEPQGAWRRAAQLSIEQSAILCSATWRRHSAKK
jgi:hypothetical protein